MGEGRDETLKRFSAGLWTRMIACHKAGKKEVGAAICEIGAALDDAIKATRPDPVPELPPYVTHCEGDWYRIEFASGDSDLMDSSCDPDDLIRISEAARILAARERARRAWR